MGSLDMMELEGSPLSAQLGASPGARTTGSLPW